MIELGARRHAAVWWHCVDIPLWRSNRAGRPGKVLVLGRSNRRWLSRGNRDIGERHYSIARWVRFGYGLDIGNETIARGILVDLVTLIGLVGIPGYGGRAVSYLSNNTPLT